MFPVFMKTQHLQFVILMQEYILIEISAGILVFCALKLVFLTH